MEEKFWRDLWPMILKSPIALFALISTFLMGYGISFLLFDYRTNPKGLPHVFHIFIGCAYTCLIFMATSWSMIFSPTKPPDLPDLAIYFPRTMVVSFAVLFIVMVCVIICRERRRGKGGQS